jgi:hypothetical protein
MTHGQRADISTAPANDLSPRLRHNRTRYHPAAKAHFAAGRREMHTSFILI